MMSGPLCVLSLFISCAPGQGLVLAQTLEPRLVWAAAGIDVEGTVSVNGKFLSFVDWRSGVSPSSFWMLAVSRCAPGSSRDLEVTGSPAG